ncbi:hypothetical protein DLM75_23620 [Leptospira stimsonii]|uniref:Uncharacterized protein n=1 Tax=Leptospira stimsonii TaxID=2202203 RepID=A0A396YKN3_9LEPT|nr:hypothetical protein DLM75_23620 [Leptospira stimsonii]
MAQALLKSGTVFAGRIRFLFFSVVLNRKTIHEKNAELGKTARMKKELDIYYRENSQARNDHNLKYFY